MANGEIPVVKDQAAFINYDSRLQVVAWIILMVIVPVILKDLLTTVFRFGS